jgi:prepilin-type N-terminal cleavage/methylation domain-containing protein
MKATSITSSTRNWKRRRGFTLIEVMVALAIFMLMLVIIFVPMTMGINVMRVGTARADVQQSSQQVLNRMTTELRKAVHVFPNDALPGVTDKAPYSSDGTIQFPYYQHNTSVCAAVSSGTQRVGNTSRVDFLLPRENGNSLVTPVEPAYYLVTYYARRADASRAYHPNDNPILLFRAQVPYRMNDGTPYMVAPSQPNALVDSSRYPNGTDCSNAAATYNRGSLWLLQNINGEPNLEGTTATPGPAATDATNTPPASHQLVMPRDMGLIAPQAAATTPNYQPETNFLLEDSNSDGKIDRVSVNLIIGKYDAGGVESRAQRVRLPQVVDLPNVR